MLVFIFNVSFKFDLEVGESVSVIWNKFNVSVIVWC